MTISRFVRLVLDDDRKVYAQLAGGKAQLYSGAPWSGGEPTGQELSGFDEQGRGPARRLVPLEPSKILCVGRNYRAHAEELGNPVPDEPLLFLKPPSALLEPDGVLELPPAELSSQVEHETELGVVVGRRARRVSAAEAARSIFGYTIACDITARDLQRRDKTWTRGKCMDGFCPVGPMVVSGIDAASLAIRCWVNDEQRQDGNTAAMIFSPADVIAYASHIMTLEPGDLIATGTPAGVGPLERGDVIRMTIDHLGELSINVR